MQSVVIEEPYEFVPPLQTNFWPSLIQLYLSRYVRKEYGVVSWECRNVERLRATVDEGHGVLLAPNHCRFSDPLVLGFLSRQVKRHLFAMASWHLFKQDWFIRFMIRRMGAFSVYREGMDRQALNAAIDILEHAKRPLVIFPEGAISRHNDQLMALMDGTAFIARTAAKRRAKNIDGGKVVVHPVAIRYYFLGELEPTVEPVLTQIEHRLAWQTQKDQELIPRIRRVAEALLALQEIQYFGRAQRGDLYERVRALIDHLLKPLEKEWGIKDREKNIVGRVKQLRTAILPDMINGQITDEERERRWRHLADCYLAQQMASYPADYVRPEDTAPEHVLETVERFEEDLTDKTSIRGPLHVVMQVGEAIEVSPKRARGEEGDPVMQGIQSQLESMLGELAKESPWKTAR